MEVLKIDLAPFNDVVQWDEYLGHETVRAAKWKNGEVEGYLDIDHMRFYEKEEFDRNFKKVAGGMSFGLAMDCLRDGYIISRSAWDISGEYVTMVMPKGYSIIAGEKVAHGAYVAVKTATNKLEPYSPTQADMVTLDWKVLKENES